MEPGECQYHLIFTAETHNFPCGVAPFPGGETGRVSATAAGPWTGLGFVCGCGTVRIAYGTAI